MSTQEHGTCECYQCYRRVPKNEAHRVTVPRKREDSSGSWGFGRRSASYFMDLQDVWLCNDCTPTTFYRGYTYLRRGDGVELPLEGEGTKHFANEEEVKSYIDSLTPSYSPVASSPVTLETQETKPNRAVAPLFTSGAKVNRLDRLPAWLIGLLGLVLSFLVTSFFLYLR